jgi:F-type H+-transporting ATPase subunit delta
MKVTVKQYAAALYGAVKDKDGNEAKSALANFLKVLVNNNDLKKADKIIAEFVNIWNKSEGFVLADVVSARRLDNDSNKTIREYVRVLSGARDVELRESVDGRLLAGFVLKFNDIVMDGSLRRKIGELKDEMVK